MPNNKKNKKNKKKKAMTVQQRIDRILERCSLSAAKELKELFSSTPAPTKSFDVFMKRLPASQRRAVTDAMDKSAKCLDSGTELQTHTTNIPGLARWFVVMEKYMDGLDVALNQGIAARQAFLEISGGFYRHHLCKLCVGLAFASKNCLKKDLDVAWAEAAVAADPSSPYAHQQLSQSYESTRQWEKSLEELDLAQDLMKGTPDDKKLDIPCLLSRLEDLNKIVHSRNKKERKESMRKLVYKSCMVPVRFWQECGIPRPPKSCAFCKYPADQFCEKCRTVCYCSRDCQVFHYPEHKISCIEPSEVKIEPPKPDYTEDEFCSDEAWRLCQDVKECMDETNVLIVAATLCYTGAVKRALMEGDSPKTISLRFLQYPVQRVALRRQPGCAVEIMRALIDHGACPNVIRSDGKHLLDVCQERALWLDDPIPGNTFHVLYRLALQNKNLEEEERKESQELVELVTEAIRMHKLCSICKASKQHKKDTMHLKKENLTDAMMGA